MNKPTLTRSKFSETVLQRSQSNAAWESADLSKSTQNCATGDSSSLRRAWLESNKSISCPFFQGHGPQAPSTLPERNSSLVAIDALTRARSAFEMDNEKIERLLKRLRTDKFAGTIDLKHHSPYLEPPKFETRCEKLSERSTVARFQESSMSKSATSFFPANL
jgi:hypothetical protein